VAVVTLFSKPHRTISEPGLYARLPWPIENVHKLDQRIQNIESQFEETKLPDQNSIFLMVYAGWKIENPEVFFPRFPGGSIPLAESALESLVRSAKNEVAGQHPFSDFISADVNQMKFAEIEKEILKRVQDQVQAQNYGIEVKFVQIKKLGLPENVTQNVFERMQSERQKLISKIQAGGEEEATKIKSAADSKAATLLAEADAKALQIRAQGEAEAIKSLGILQTEPRLANFNMKLSALEQMLKEKTTLILDQSTPPLDLLNTNVNR
jgi:membrane protease subunit HflC